MDNASLKLGASLAKVCKDISVLPTEAEACFEFFPLGENVTPRGCSWSPGVNLSPWVEVIP
jgi:hypothetical protein